MAIGRGGNTVGQTELENSSENCGSLHPFRPSLNFPLDAYALSKILHGLENTLHVLDPFAEGSLEELGGPSTIPYSCAKFTKHALTAATAEDVRDSGQPLPYNPNNYPFEWPYRRYRGSSPRSDRYSWCLDRCWFQGGNRCNQRNRSFPRAHGIQGHRPSFPTRSGA